jgi:hypothetical protein
MVLKEGWDLLLPLLLLQKQIPTPKKKLNNEKNEENKDVRCK